MAVFQIKHGTCPLLVNAPKGEPRIEGAGRWLQGGLPPVPNRSATVRWASANVSRKGAMSDQARYIERMVRANRYFARREIERQLGQS